MITWIQICLLQAPDIPDQTQSPTLPLPKQRQQGNFSWRFVSVSLLKHQTSRPSKTNTYLSTHRSWADGLYTDTVIHYTKTSNWASDLTKSLSRIQEMGQRLVPHGHVESFILFLLKKKKQKSITKLSYRCQYMAHIACLQFCASYWILTHDPICFSSFAMWTRRLSCHRVPNQ